MPVNACLHPRAKEAILREFDGDREVVRILDSVADCRNDVVMVPCPTRIRTKRPQSQYQEFISHCLKGKSIKGFGEAGPALKACAQEWRKIKSH